MYFTITAIRWCIELGRESWMLLTYHRDVLPERGFVRDFLISAEPITAPSPA